MLSFRPLELAMKHTRKIVLLLVLILILTGFLYWLFYWRYFQSTDNAYVQADITNISARVSAVVVNSMIQDNHPVQKGDLLAQLDDREFVVALQKAAATLAQSRAALTNAQATYQMQISTIDEFRSDVASAAASLQYARQQYLRFQILQKKNYVSQGDMDNALSGYKVAEAKYNQAQASLKTQSDKLKVQQSEIEQNKANVEQAQANLEQAKLILSYTRIIAPIDGVISNRSLQVGMMVQAGQSIASIVSGNAPWISANFKETQKALMRKGLPVEVTIDAYPGKTFHGRIDSFSPATGATFALLPPDNATGNFTKVVQRVPVKIIFDHPEQIDSGLSATVTVDTRG
ncbi:HlyD family secretion protein [Brenneria goodwinii]|uniref:HlyD family secretion protein n=1 Tax=Brenneria goodwinii TaxID=1109412 RepID=UPI001E5546AE|nr:HlyD family secretion protein [Brenneria goodwinii]